MASKPQIKNVREMHWTVNLWLTNWRLTLTSDKRSLSLLHGINKNVKEKLKIN